MPRIRISPQAMRHSAAAFSRAQQSSDALLTQLQTQVGKLDGRWQGLSKTRFLAEWPTYKKKMKTLSEMLDHMAQTLDHVATGFEQQDRKGAARVAAIGGAGAGAARTYLAETVLTKERRRPTIPAPRIYIINGITNDPKKTADRLSKRMAKYMEDAGYPEDQVKASAPVYYDHSDKFDVGGVRGKEADIDDLKDEYHASQDGKMGRYSKETYDHILKDLGKNPLRPGQRLIIMGHSGGGAIAASVAPQIEKQGHQVAGVVTLGSPWVNWEGVEPTGAKMFAITDEDDPFSNKANEDYVTNHETALQKFKTVWVPSPRPPFRRPVQVERPVTPTEAHNSYMTSPDVLNYLEKKFKLQSHLD